MYVFVLCGVNDDVDDHSYHRIPTHNKFFFLISNRCLAISINRNHATYIFNFQVNASLKIDSKINGFVIIILFCFFRILYIIYYQSFTFDFLLDFGCKF